MGKFLCLIQLHLKLQFSGKVDVSKDVESGESDEVDDPDAEEKVSCSSQSGCCCIIITS